MDADEQNGVKMQEEALDLTNIISREQATTLAEKQRKSASNRLEVRERIRNHLLGSESERGPTKIEVKIDAHSGKILTTERDD